MNEPSIAYLSMEIGIEPAMPTYAGGLGVLAGDTIRGAADMGLPLVGVSLLHRKGYFVQHLDNEGRQREEAAGWPVQDFLREMPPRACVSIEGRSVRLRCWTREVHGCTGHRIPVYLLDADLAENTESDRSLTDHLYGGDVRYRLCQEIILGIGGISASWTGGGSKGTSKASRGGPSGGQGTRSRVDDAIALYDKLEQVILSLFYRDRSRFIDVMRHAISLNGSFFTAQRMVQEYAVKAYRDPGDAP